MVFLKQSFTDDKVHLANLHQQDLFIRQSIVGLNELAEWTMITGQFIGVLKGVFLETKI
jgi:hypothetical protein